MAERACLESVAGLPPDNMSGRFEAPAAKRRPPAGVLESIQ
jgi:hypothetical protein